MRLKSTKPCGYFWLSYYKERRQSLENRTRRQAYLGEGATNRHDFYLLPAALYNHINIHLTCLHSYSNK